jgi:hypothetical protein
MAAGEVIIQSMWSPAVAAVRVKEILHLRSGQREKRQGGLSRLVQRHGAHEASERQENSTPRMSISTGICRDGRAPS